jgi:hypothetical protein
MMRKELKISFFLFDIFNLVLLTITTVFMATLNTEFNNAGNIVQLFFSNWNNSYIQDITVSDTLDCPYSYNPLVLDTFSGTVEGCDCTNGTNSINKLLRDKCYTDNSTVLPSTCVQVQAIPNQTLYFWKSKVLCAKRGNVNYLNLMIKESNSSCPQNTKNCGRIDTRIDNKLCIDLSLDCPVKEIKITSKNESLGKGFSKIEFDDDNNLIFSRNSGSPGISYLQTSEGLNCINPSEKNSIGEPYKLLSNFYNYPCKSIINDNMFDTRFREISQEARSNLYEENNISLIEDLPLYPKVNSTITPVTLYYSPFIGINPYCKESSTIDFINNLLQLEYNYEWISYAHLFQYIVSIVDLSFFSIGFFLSIVRKYNQAIYLIQFYVIMIGLSILHIVPNSLSFKYSSIMSDTLKSGYLNDCFDSVTNLQFHYFSKNFISIKNKLIVTIVFNSTQLGFFLFAVILLIFINK